MPDLLFILFSSIFFIASLPKRSCNECQEVSRGHSIPMVDRLPIRVPDDWQCFAGINLHSFFISWDPWTKSDLTSLTSNQSKGHMACAFLIPLMVQTEKNHAQPLATVRSPRGALIRASIGMQMWPAAWPVDYNKNNRSLGQTVQLPTLVLFSGLHKRQT